MENIFELLCDLPSGKIYGKASPFVRAARTKVEKMEMLNATMINVQKQLLEGYFDADAKSDCIMNFDRFRYAFHLDARLMEELIEGKEEVL